MCRIIAGEPSGPEYRFNHMGTDRPQLLPALLLSGFTVLVAAFASLPYTETAAIKIAVPAQRLETTVAMNSGGANLAIQRFVVQATDSGQGTATGSIAVPTYATGVVTFHLTCPTSGPCQPITVASGTIVATAKDFRYATQNSATLQAGNQDAPVGIRAIASGAAGNTAPNTITVIPNNQHPNVLTVFNKLAVGGGTDAGAGQVIQQSDVDAAQAALAAKVTDELSAAIMAQAKGQTYIVDGPPVLAFMSDHAVGEQVSTFTLTMIGKEGAAAFFDSAAQAILRASLRPLVLPGYELTPDPIQANYQLVQPAAGTDVFVTADAVAYAIPKVSRSLISTRLTGLSLSDAHRRLDHDFPGSLVEIRTRPVALPWLPLVADHINLTITVAPVI
jgi:hypothetical protein